MSEDKRQVILEYGGKRWIHFKANFNVEFINKVFSLTIQYCEGWFKDSRNKIIFEGKFEIETIEEGVADIWKITPIDKVKSTKNIIENSI